MVRDLIQMQFQGVAMLTAFAALLFTARSLDHTSTAPRRHVAQIELADGSRGVYQEPVTVAIKDAAPIGQFAIRMPYGPSWTRDHAARGNAPALLP
jgi:hypothetical protein